MELFSTQIESSRILNSTSIQKNELKSNIHVDGRQSIFNLHSCLCPSKFVYFGPNTRIYSPVSFCFRFIYVVVSIHLYSFLAGIQSMLNGRILTSQLLLNYNSTARSFIPLEYPGLQNNDPN